VVMWGRWKALHNETFVDVGGRRVREGFIGLGSAECTASGLDLGGVRKSCAHLTDEIFKTWANIPIPLGGGFVEGDTPSDGITTDQLLRYFAFCCQIEFGPYDDHWDGLMEKRADQAERAGGGDGVVMRRSEFTEEYGLRLPGRHLLGGISVVVGLQFPVD
jgi:hypothetical protein